MSAMNGWLPATLRNDLVGACLRQVHKRMFNLTGTQLHAHYN